MKSRARGLLGSLVAVPLVAALFGSQWTWDERVAASGVRVVDEETGGEIAAPRGSGEAAAAVALPAQAVAEVSLPRPLRAFTLELVADGGRSFQVAAVSDDGPPVLLWLALADPDLGERAVRRSPPLRAAAPVEQMRITPYERDEATSLTALAAITPRVSIPHLALGVLPWLAFGGLWFVGRRPQGEVFADRTAAVWQRADLWLASAAVYAILFRLVTPGWLGLAAAAFIVGAVFALRRAPVPTLSIAATVAAIVVIAPKLITAIVVASVSQQFDLTVDHRPVPDGRNINSDGLRFRGEAADVSDDEFVVLFLGDSFTFGTRLPNRATYPHVFETLANRSGCDTRVRAINFGWVSSSPLLGLRLLRRIGYAYKPDLIVYNLDATDFHDDLRYERALRSAGEFEVDTARAVRQFAGRALPWLDLDALEASGAGGLLRPGPPRVVGAEAALPEDRFFATGAPLDVTRSWIERGVMKNLGELHRFAADTLGAPMVLVLYPRAYQYSARESPENWEADSYEVLGPYVREPFRYFDEQADALPYPVVNLMPTFEHSEAFPLFLADDPHWNRDGARLVARSVQRALGELEALPCAAP